MLTLECRSDLKEIESLQVLLCADLNCPADKPDMVLKYLNDNNYFSTHKSTKGYDPKCTHLNHLHEEAPTDYIFLRSSDQSLVPVESFLYPK